MKKIILTAFFGMLMLSSSLYAQSNLTWTFKDKYVKETAKDITVLNASFTGFEKAEDVSKFCQTLKNNAYIASLDVVASTANSCDLKVTMKEPQERNFYLGLASKMNVKYIEFNGTKKTIQEWGK